MKNFLYAVSSGLLLALAWPTYGFAFLLFFAFVPLLYAEFKVRNSQKSFIKLRVFGLAYLSFLIWNVITTYWLYFSTPFGGIFAILANSLLMSIVFLLYHIVAKRTDFKAGMAFLASIWMVFEKIHLQWDFSWPWLNLGNGFATYHHWIQWYEYTGTFGGTLWVWLANIAVFKMILLYGEHRQKAILYRGLLKTALIIAVPIAISYIILADYKEGDKKIEAVILQPNINPYTEKYNTTDTRIGELLMKLSKEKVDSETTLLVAPETVFADGTVLSQFSDSEAAFYGRQLTRKHPNLSFLSGISFYERFHNPKLVKPQSNNLGPNDWYNDYNSAFFMNNKNEPEFYHKSKLVVGVETFPYQSILKPLLGNIMIDLGGTVSMKTTQKNRGVFKLTDSSFVAPIICYESVYGEYVTGYVKNGANFLAITTNDAWWGDTQGHKQHLSYAKLRAIESRRSIVRSANTGTSAFINEKGDIVQTLGYQKRGSIKGMVTLNSEKTFYVKHGDYIARIAEFLALFIFLFAIVKYKRKVNR